MQGRYSAKKIILHYLNSEMVSNPNETELNQFPIKQIEIIGNEKTDADIIFRELLFSQGDLVSLKKIIAAQKRVLNTGLFTQARFDIIGEGDFYTLLITVYERWYIYPIPLLNINERSWSKISYGFQLLYYNFAGRDILLNFTAAFGYNPQFKLAYYNPWFFGDLKLFTNFMVYKGKVQAKNPALDNLEYDKIGLDWLIGKRFGHFTFLGLTYNYTEISQPLQTGLTLSPSGRDIVPSITLSLQYDNRDYKEYPHSGCNVQFWTKKAGNSKRIDYNLYGADLRGYLPLNNSLTIAMRGAVNLTSGDIPLYERSFFGFNERIRGRFYDIFEGENLAFGGIEFRFPVLPITYMDVPPVPGFEQYSSHLKFGASAGIFYDTGAVWFQDKELSRQDFKSGFGAGIHFHLPYIDVFRIECGLNSDWETQFIAEINTAF